MRIPVTELKEATPTIPEDGVVDNIKHLIVAYAANKKKLKKKAKAEKISEIINCINQLKNVNSLEIIFQYMQDGPGKEIKKEADRFRKAKKSLQLKFQSISKDIKDFKEKVQHKVKIERQNGIKKKTQQTKSEKEKVQADEEKVNIEKSEKSYGNTKSYEKIVSALIARYTAIAKENPHESYAITKIAKHSPLIHSHYTRSEKIDIKNHFQEIEAIGLKHKSKFFIFKRPKTTLKTYDSKEQPFSKTYDERMDDSIKNPINGFDTKRFSTLPPNTDALIGTMTAACTVGSTFFHLHRLASPRSHCITTSHIHSSFYLHARVDEKQKPTGFVAALTDDREQPKHVSERDKKHDNTILRASKFAAKSAILQMNPYNDPDTFRMKLKEIKDRVVAETKAKKDSDCKNTTMIAYSTFKKDDGRMQIAGFSIGKNMLVAWDPINRKLTQIFSPHKESKACFSDHDGEFMVFENSELHPEAIVIALTKADYEFLPKVETSVKERRKISADGKKFDHEKYHYEQKDGVWYATEKEETTRTYISLDPDAIKKIIGDERSSEMVIKRILDANVEGADRMREQNFHAFESQESHVKDIGGDSCIGACQLQSTRR